MDKSFLFNHVTFPLDFFRDISKIYPKVFAAYAVKIMQNLSFPLLFTWKGQGTSHEGVTGCKNISRSLNEADFFLRANIYIYYTGYPTHILCIK